MGRWQIILAVGLLGILTTGCGGGRPSGNPALPLPVITKTTTLGGAFPLVGIQAEDQFWADCRAFTTTGVSSSFAKILWSDVEPANDQFTIGEGSYLGRVADQAQLCGISLNLKIRTGQVTWATGGNPNINIVQRPSLPPLDMAEYREYLQKVVSFFRDRGIHAKYAVENEIVSPTWWGGTGTEYLALLNEAYQVIKATDPDAQVVDFGFPSESYLPLVAWDIYQTRGADAALDFWSRYIAHRAEWADPPVHTVGDLEAVFASSTFQALSDFVEAHFSQGSFDIYQLHFYEEWDLLPEVVAWIEGRMAKSGLSRPIEGWEIGYAWDTDSTYDPDDHAQDLIRLVVTALDNDVVWVNDLPYEAVADVEIWRGLYDPQGVPRPAFTAFTRLVSKIKTAKRVERFSFSDATVSGYRFTLASGQAVYILWTSGGTATIRLPVTEATVQVTDYLGNISQGDPARLSIRGIPVIVE